MSWLWGSSKNLPPVVPAQSEEIDFSQLNKTWYEIGSIKSYFQQGLKNTTVTYSLQADGTYSVQNKGYKEDGSESGVKGTLSCPDTKEKAKLKLQIHLFAVFNPTSDFWIIEVGPEWSYFVASGPKRGCWILSAKPTMEDDTYNAIIERCKGHGIDVTAITKTEQTQQ